MTFNNTKHPEIITPKKSINTHTKHMKHYLGHETKYVKTKKTCITVGGVNENKNDYKK